MEEGKRDRLGEKAEPRLQERAKGILSTPRGMGSVVGGGDPANNICSKVNSNLERWKLKARANLCLYQELEFPVNGTEVEDGYLQKRCCKRNYFLKRQ